MDLKSGFCADLLSSSTPALASYVFMELALCIGALSCWSRFRSLDSSEGKL